MIGAVLFDFGGTLDSDGIPWLDRFLPLYEKAGVRPPGDALVRAFYRADDGLAARFPLNGLDLEETVRLQVGCVVSEVCPDRRDLVEPIVRGFVDPCRRRFERNRPLLERLKTRFRLGIVSNFYGNLRGILDAEGLGALFEAVADSGEVGVLKPEEGLFRHALERLGVDPRRTLMVGDSLHRDMAGAHRLGMPHAWLAGPEDPRTPCCPSVLRLRSLGELEPLLSREPSSAGAPR